MVSKIVCVLSSFVEAYYQWMETIHSANASNTIVTSSDQGVTHASKNLLNIFYILNFDSFIFFKN